MQKKPLLKTSLEYLKNDFPENLLPTKSYTKKQKRLLKKITKEKTIKKIIDKKIEFLRIRKIRLRKKKFFKFLRFTKQPWNRCYLLAPDQLKKDLFEKPIQSRRFYAFSDFLLKLRERKKLSILYGNLSKKYFQKIYSEARKYPGKKIETFLTLLETRLDIVLYRICFFKNIYSARQAINHNQILVNGKILNISTYNVSPGDVLSVNPKKKKIIANQMLQSIKKQIFRRRKRSFFYKKSKLKKHLTQIKGEIKRNLKWRFRQDVLFSSLKSYMFEKYFNLEEGQKVFSIIKELYDREVQFPSLLPYYNTFITSKFRKRYNISKIRKSFSLLLARKLNFIVQHARLRIKRRMALSPKIKRRAANLVDFIYFLKKLPLYRSTLERKWRRKRSSRHITKGMRLTPMKPLNIEASFKLLTAVVLYSPQKLVFPSLLHTDFTYSSFK